MSTQSGVCAGHMEQGVDKNNTIDSYNEIYKNKMLRNRDVRSSGGLLLGGNSLGSTHERACFGGNKSTHDAGDLYV